MSNSKVKSTAALPGAKGGNHKMASQSGAAPVVAGQVSLGGRSAGNTFSVSGGNGKMAGFTGAKPATPR